MNKPYIFVSFSNEVTRKNLGCCIIQYDEDDFLEKCERLGLKPDGANNIIGQPLSEEEFQAQGIELNRFYTLDEMLQEGFEKISSNESMNSETMRFICIKSPLVR